MHRTSSRSKDRLVVVLCLTAIAAYAVLMRCLHLLNPDHYYIVSADSYFFHWQADRLMSGQSLFLTWHSGLTYALAYVARVISFVSGMAPVDALTLAGKLIPPMLGAVTLVAIYLAASRMYSRRVGLWAAFGSAILSYTVMVQTAGYLDRDGLSMLLLTIGVFVFYFSRGWHYRIAGRDIGWVIGPLIVIVIEGLLFLEWLWIGVALLLAVLIAFVVSEVLIDLLLHLAQTPTKGKDATISAKQSMMDAVAAVRGSSWRPLALIVGVSVVVGAITPGVASISHTAAETARDLFSKTGGVSELQPFSVEDIYLFGVLIIPLLVGMYVTVTRHRKEDLLCLSWFACLFGMGLFATRLFIYAAPATCIICGVGLASIFRFDSVSKSPSCIRIGGEILVGPSPRFLKMCGAMLLLVPLLLAPPYAAYHSGSGGRVAANTEWQRALAYLKQNSPEDSTVMSWWDYGYWILDMADRRPVVDNGMYGWDQERLDDVGLAYCTTEPSEAVRVMQKHGADYLIFSRVEVAILPSITTYGLGVASGDGRSVPDELKDSLYNRSLYGDFQSGDGLRRVYPSAEVEHPEVVIIGLE
jgi:asparagine N-glycosylation enzyme membrane subunit Stt3